jgi:phytoene/squalene synthetase
MFWSGTVTPWRICGPAIQRPVSRRDARCHRCRAKLFLEGLPLVKTVDKRLAFDLELFSRGGMRVLEKIEQQNYNVFAKRPAISKFERVQLLVGSLWNTL